MPAVSAVQNSTLLSTEKAPAEKLVHAAHQFEALLLNQLLGSLEHTFCALGKDKTELGSDRYQFLGVQALASTIAAKGGLGIADMIVRNLKSQHIPGPGSAIATKKPL
jgi:Rod binding domain-containing protein